MSKHTTQAIDNYLDRVGDITDENLCRFLALLLIPVIAVGKLIGIMTFRLSSGRHTIPDKGK